ncbi:type I glyceraldehyde-3-phosphate dehydrogenase, partial [Arhodomonas aquaeolei]|uniref:type I glyceraldehyde-3-phosphate dehydrogenase n=1 Tax=Arhodomonas aquaeolei TaxID=2369 RepID=UPI000378F35A
ELRVVAVNDLGDVETNAHLTRHDTTHGRFPGEVAVSEGALEVNGDRIEMLSERDPAKLPWGELGVDVVLECTGLFASGEKASAHLAAGARKVVISAPAGSDVDATVVYGVNHSDLREDHAIVSNASCTTNCLAPVVKVLNDRIGIEHGLMTTVHAYTNDQVLTDVYHKDPRRARSATSSQIPTKTGAAAMIGQVIPSLAGRLDGYAIRVPTINVSMVDLTCVLSRESSVEAVNALMREAAEGDLAGVVGYNEAPLVSVDFNHDARSSVFDATLTKVTGGTLLKACAWYDNEWGFSSRMLDTTVALMNAGR